MLKPVIYKVMYDDEKSEYYLQPNMPKFRLPKKLYGDIEEKANYFFRYYKEHDEGLGIILTGIPGAGKTELMKKLSNIALEHKMPVITVTDVYVSTDIIQFLSSIKNAVLLLDEFGKNFPNYIQEKMLTMLSDIDDNRNIFLLTENNQNMISNFIRNRPQRARYHIDYERIKECVIDDYCKDMKVEEFFIRELKSKYEESTLFSFDYLQALVSEHMFSPNMHLDEMLEIMNLKALNKDIYLYVDSVYDIKDKVDIKFNDLRFKYDAFVKNNRSFWLNLQGEIEEEREQKQPEPNKPIQMKPRKQDHWKNIRLTIKDSVLVEDFAIELLVEKRFKVTLKKDVPDF